MSAINPLLVFRRDQPGMVKAITAPGPEASPADQCRGALKALDGLKVRLADEELAHYAQRAQATVQAAHKLIASGKLTGLECARLHILIDELTDKVKQAGAR